MHRTQVEEMRSFLAERYGITTNKQLRDRIKEMPKINLAIFREVNTGDNRRGTENRRAIAGTTAG